MASSKASFLIAVACLVGAQTCASLYGAIVWAFVALWWVISAYRALLIEGPHSRGNEWALPLGRLVVAVREWRRRAANSHSAAQARP